MLILFQSHAQSVPLAQNPHSSRAMSSSQSQTERHQIAKRHFHILDRTEPHTVFGPRLSTTVESVLKIRCPHKRTHQMKARGGDDDDNAMDRRTTVSPPNYVFMHFRLNPGINEYADTCYCASAAAALFLCRRRTPVIVVGLVPKPFKMLVTVVVLLCTMVWMVLGSME